MYLIKDQECTWKSYIGTVAFWLFFMKKINAVMRATKAEVVRKPTKIQAWAGIQHTPGDLVT